MSDWRVVTRVYTTQSRMPGPHEIVRRVCMVNMDNADALDPFSATRHDGAKTRILWHSTSPRVEWDVAESMEDLTR